MPLFHSFPTHEKYNFFLPWKYYPEDTCPLGLFKKPPACPRIPDGKRWFSLQVTRGWSRVPGAPSAGCLTGSLGAHRAFPFVQL